MERRGEEKRREEKKREENKIKILTAKKKSLTSCVIYTASPMYIKWKR